VIVDVSIRLDSIYPAQQSRLFEVQAKLSGRVVSSAISEFIREFGQAETTRVCNKAVFRLHPQKFQRYTSILHLEMMKICPLNHQGNAAFTRVVF
jgi:hypothetical protein